MQQYAREALAAMDVESLRGHIIELREVKRENARRMGERDSPIGKRIVERLEKRLVGILSEYNGVKVSGQADRDVVLRVYAIQLHERFVRSELSSMKDSEKKNDMLDDYLKICNDTLKVKESARKRTR